MLLTSVLDVGVQLFHSILDILEATSLARHIRRDVSLQLVDLSFDTLRHDLQPVLKLRVEPLHHLGMFRLEVVQVHEMRHVLQCLGDAGINPVAIHLLARLGLEDVQIDALPIGHLRGVRHVPLDLADLADDVPPELVGGATQSGWRVAPSLDAGRLRLAVEVVVWDEALLRILARARRPRVLARWLGLAAFLRVARHGSSEEIQRVTAGLGTRLRYHEKTITADDRFPLQINGTELEPIQADMTQL